MSTITQPTFEAKIAKAIYNNLTPFVVRASIHPVLSKLNLHNNRLLKKINTKAKMVYYMSYEPDAIVKASYDKGGEDNIENALLTIQELVHGDHHADHKEYIFKRLDFLTSEAIEALYSRNHQDWLYRIGNAIQNAKEKQTKKRSVVKPGKKTLIKPVKKKTSKKTKTATPRRRHKKGQFISSRR